MKKYYIYQNNQQQGPFSIEELRNMNISPGTHVWAEGMGEWTPASQVSELINLFRTATPPPSSQTRTGPYQHGQKQYSRQQTYRQADKKSGGKTVGIVISVIAVIIVGILALYLFSPGEPEWHEFISIDGGFAINMPASVDKQSEIIKTAAGNMEIFTYTAEIYGGSFLVSYVDYPEEILTYMDDRQIMLAALDGAMSTMGCTVNSDWNVDVGGYSGIRFEAAGNLDGKNVESKGLYVLKYNRLYQIIILNEELKVSFDMVDTFLGSFRFV
jgi:hypothetical protein